jgi:hypothetical protein
MKLQELNQYVSCMLIYHVCQQQGVVSVCVVCSDSAGVPSQLACSVSHQFSRCPLLRMTAVQRGKYK